MGNKVPHDKANLFCPWDNPNFPAGETPRFASVTLSGICVDPTMPELVPTLINGSYECEQISAYTWQYWNGDILVNLFLSATETRVTAMRGWYQFGSSVAAPLVHGLTNELQLGFGEYYYLGGAHWNFWTDIVNLAAGFAVGSTGKTFSEQMGQDIRLAERKQGTCVSIRKVQNV